MMTVSDPSPRFQLHSEDLPADSVTLPRLPSLLARPVHAGAVSDSWLLAWTISRSGFPSVVALGHQPAAFPHHAIATGPRFGLHLASALPMQYLLQALSALRGKRSPRAVLLVADPPHPKTAAYREHLHLDAQQQVLAIRRNFRKRRHAQPRPVLVGIVWKLSDERTTPREPLPGSPWRTVRALFKTSRFGIFRHVVAADVYAACAHQASDAMRSTLLAQLTPPSLRALAADLEYRPLHPGADFCFAHKDARIDDGALLRGPLFIDPGTVITPDHVHVGPGWITPASPAVTLVEAQDGRPSPDGLPAPFHPRAASAAPGPAGGGGGAGEVGGIGEPGPYFVGPATRHRPGYDAAKRLFDIAFSLVALAVTLPICIMAAIAIKLYDRGPIFFAHNRESLHGKPFGCLKFRTMVRNAEALKKKLRGANQVDGPQFKIARDPRVTPIGQFLRKTNIDELPQFINVLLGDMSVVGPRPSPFEENQLCPAWREARLSVKPGITGLWQVSRSRERGAADFQEWIYYDTQYVDRRSFLLDMRIVLLTIKEFLGQGQ
jgi:lipopolysaccharide/colanic/teichoic acid biosynthesis glycosyltransferase